MPKKKPVQDLSDEELRWLLIEKRRAARQERIERYRRTGRVIMVEPDSRDHLLENWHTGSAIDGETTANISKSKRFLDFLLLLIEISAVIGFIYILFNGLNLIRQLNREVVTALNQPTLTPTPLIMAVVLPSGHTPPNSPGGAQFNEAEIPAHLRPLVQSLVNIPIPTPGPEQAIRIQIPAIRVDAPVVQGDSWEQLKKGVGEHTGSVNPGQKGNLILSAHNDIFGEIFRDLEQLKPGDPIYIYTGQRAYVYVVGERNIVEPTAVEALAPANQPILTLISCYPYLVDNRRVVVIAHLQG